MTFRLQPLLDLRRDAEKNALQAFTEASSRRVREDEEQARVVMRWRRAQTRASQEADRMAREPAPDTAGQATARYLYLRRLREETVDLAARAEEHRTGALAHALAAEQAARDRYERARTEREVVDKVKERGLAEDKKLSGRRQEDAAADLAHAALRPRGGENE
jgi:hypothetical protein